MASVESMGRKPGGWDEIAVGAVRDEASVDVRAAGHQARGVRTLTQSAEPPYT